MNFLKAAYCRIFQTVFKIALPILPYTTPKILHSIQDLPEEYLKKGIGKVLLVTDANLRSLTTELEQLLPEKGIEVIVYDKTKANPTVSNVEDAVELYLKENCKGLIAFGGGSSMDCAKAVGARIAYPRRTVNQMKGILKVARKIPLLTAIPTTAGTGSEVTLAAVITDDKTHFKYPINSFPLIPSIAVLDPKVTYSLPKSLTATTGMDALTHAVEAFIGGSTTKQTRKWALDAVQLIFANIENAFNNPTDETARKNMLLAANYAGSAFSQSYVGYVHAVAHSLGGAYNIPHGLANSVLLPIVLEEYGEAAWKKLKQLAVSVNLANKDTPEEEAAENFITEIRSMNKRMGIPEKLQGIKDEDIPVLAKRADKEGNPLYPVPVLWNAKELENLYKLVKE